MLAGPIDIDYADIAAPSPLAEPSLFDAHRYAMQVRHRFLSGSCGSPQHVRCEWCPPNGGLSPFVRLTGV